MSDRNSGDSEGVPSEPFGDIVDEVAKRRGKTDDEIWEEFTEQGFERVETDGIRAAPTDGRSDPGDGSGPGADILFRGGGESTGGGGNGSTTGDADGEIHTVPKQTHCERCPRFGEPPEVSCSADGTEIVELVDMTHVRVKGCPIAADQDSLDGIL